MRQTRQQRPPGAVVAVVAVATQKAKRSRVLVELPVRPAQRRPDRLLHFFRERNSTVAPHSEGARPTPVGRCDFSQQSGQGRTEELSRKDWHSS
jgi:hypothetical protein